MLVFIVMEHQPTKLSVSAIKKALSLLQFNWKVDKHILSISLETKNFAEAIWLINEIAKIAEELNHHPDLSLENYNQVSIRLTTHDATSLTEKDFAIAEKIDAIITRIKNP